MTDSTPAPQREKDPEEDDLEDRVKALEGKFDALIDHLQPDGQGPGVDGLTDDDRLDRLEKRTAGIIDALSQLYDAPAINDALAGQDRDTPLRFRVPTVVLDKVEECTAEALELAERVWHFVEEMDRLGDTLSVLSHDETLPVAKTTHDPQGERLDALNKATGYNKVEEAENFILAVLGRARDELNLPDLRASLRA